MLYRKQGVQISRSGGKTCKTCVCYTCIRRDAREFPLVCPYGGLRMCKHCEDSERVIQCDYYAGTHSAETQSAGGTKGDF